MADTIPGWDDAEEVDPEQVPDDVLVPGSRPRVNHNQRERTPLAKTDWARSPRSYVVNGNLRTDLYPIAAFTEATGLPPVTIRKWEQTGVLPVPVLRGPCKAEAQRRGYKGQRLYSREFIAGVAVIVEEEGLAENRRNVHMTNFSTRVHELFRRTGG